MTNQQKNLLKMAALLDIVLAIGLFAAIVLFGVASPIIAPVLLGFMGVAMFAASYLVK